MKKHLTLFSRLFITLSAVVLTAVLLMSVVTVSVLQRERQAAYEYEILSQLRGVSDILEESYYIHDLRLNNTLSRLIREKMSSIYAKYKGTIWVVNWNSSGQNVVLFLDSDWTNTETLIYEEDVMYQFDRIRKGHEIRETGLIPDLGNDIVTLGVPWTYRTYQDEIVVGAVLMHVKTNDLTVNLSDLLPQILLVACLVLSLGLVLSATVARSQSRPIRQMQSIRRRLRSSNVACTPESALRLPNRIRNRLALSYAILVKKVMTACAISRLLPGVSRMARHCSSI